MRIIKKYSQNKCFVNINPVDNVDKPVNNHDKAPSNVNNPMDNFT